MIDVVVPTGGRPAGLAVTLAGLAAQEAPARLVLADQGDPAPSYEAPEVAAVLRVLRHRGWEVELHHRREKRGVTEQRHFLLSRVRSPQHLALDDDVLLEPGAMARLADALATLGCGFVGMALDGLSYAGDVRPHEQAAFEPWEGPVVPERVRKGTPGWERWRLHNAANVVHLAARVEVPPRGWVAYKVAWVAGCVLWDTAALRASGGFDFHGRVGRHGYGEDVVAQLRTMERYGGAGLLPSLAHHLELPTSLPVREVDAYEEVLGEETGTPVGC
ncbi:glycosyltransferase family 2 protein [Vallicoccus soli]|uniref:Glycosyltransferase n=1 Tax=Vallicoccus soli TaxID=2339232 RepID=A0A3A3ZIY9_9ACTN|nr:glycosyltransferase [Vallicoccus soli]RJK95452.1 glycosyltransferase [Vallicoccus soli]